jgi:hypothetical protein
MSGTSQGHNTRDQGIATGSDAVEGGIARGSTKATSFHHTIHITVCIKEVD